MLAKAIELIIIGVISGVIAWLIGLGLAKLITVLPHKKNLKGSM